MHEGTRDEPLPIDPQLEHPAAEWGNNTGPSAGAAPNPAAGRPVRQRPLAEQLAEYHNDVEESREVL